MDSSANAFSIKEFLNKYKEILKFMQTFSSEDLIGLE
jgi:hypothetical protein